MPPRASWKGQLRLSLVAFPIRLYNAISSSTRVSLNQLHKDCHQRLRQQMICPAHGPVERGDIAKGYEYEKSKFVVLEESDLQSVMLESTKTIEITQFVDAAELDQLYLDAPYFLAPDGPVAEDAFRVIREALRASNKVALGRVVMSNREHVVAIQVHEQGFLLTTLHYASEVRAAGPYFEEIREGPIDRNQLALAQQLIEQYSGSFDASQFSDRYQDALLALVKAKIAGSEPMVVQESEAGQVINLMEALKQSLAQTAQRKPPAESLKPARAAKPRKSKGA